MSEENTNDNKLSLILERLDRIVELLEGVQKFNQWQIENAENSQEWADQFIAQTVEKAREMNRELHQEFKVTDNLQKVITSNKQ